MEADVVIDASASSSFPAGSIRIRIWSCRLAGRSSSDDFFTGTRAAAFGGTTTIIDFAVQTKGESMTSGVDAWHKKAEGKTCDRLRVSSHHDRVRGRRREGDVHADGRGHHVASSCSWPIRACFSRTTRRSFVRCRRPAQRGGLICMHAENGIVINEIIKRFLADGRTAPKYHALTRPTIAEAEGVHRAIAIAEMAESPVYIVHLSLHRRAQSRSGRRATAAFRRLPRLARNIFSIRSTITATVGKVRNT